MARLTATDYQTLAGLTGTDARTIGNNTTARRDPLTSDITVSLHGSDIVRLSPDGAVAFNLAGYNTVTTRERVNQFLPEGVSLNNVQRRPVLSDRRGGEAETLTVDVAESGWVGPIRPDCNIFAGPIGPRVALAEPGSPGSATCGNCGRTWDNTTPTSVTPAPSALCPFCNAGATPVRPEHAAA